GPNSAATIGALVGTGVTIENGGVGTISGSVVNALITGAGSKLVSDGFAITGDATFGDGAVATVAQDFAVAGSVDVTGDAVVTVGGALVGVRLSSGGTLSATQGGTIDIATVLQSTLGSVSVDALGRINIGTTGGVAGEISIGAV